MKNYLLMCDLHYGNTSEIKVMQRLAMLEVISTPKFERQGRNSYQSWVRAGRRRRGYLADAEVMERVFHLSSPSTL